MIAVPARSELGLQREMELIAPAAAVDWQPASWQWGGESAKGELYRKTWCQLNQEEFSSDGSWTENTSVGISA